MRLKWSLTWEDKPDDYKAADPETGQPVGRIYFRGSGAEGSHAWAWFGQGAIGKRYFSERGDELTKQEAADAMTKRWFEFKAMMRDFGSS